MSLQGTPLLNLPVAAAGALTPQRFVTYAGAQAGNGANTMGVARTAAVNAGDQVPVDVIGTAPVEAGAAIAAGAQVQSDANGRAITWAAGPVVGRALQAAVGVGDFVEILLIPN
jgi:hypothetical protein